MADWRETIPVDVTSVDVEIPRGNIEVRAAPTNEPGYLEAETALQVDRSGGELLVRSDSGWPADLEIALPASVRRLRLSTGKGDVEVEGVEVDLEVETGKGNVGASSGGRGDIQTGSGDIQIGTWRGPLQVSTGKGNVEVGAAPNGLELNTGKGDIRVSDAAGRVEANTGKGNLVFGRLSGDARLQTGKGDVVVTDLADARLDVQTSRGNVALDGRVARLRARLSHGDVTCRCAFAGESFEVTTDHGNLHVELADESPLRIEAIAGHGRVDSALPLVKVGRPGPAGAHSQRFVASLGGTNPTATLRLYSAHGDIWIGRPGEAPQGGDSDWRTREYDFSESATARAWAETLRNFPSEDVARRMASLGERIGKRVGESVEQAMERLESEMERLEAEMERVEEEAEKEAEREEARAEAEEEREERLAEEEEEREERLAEEEEEREERLERDAERRQEEYEARRRADAARRAATPPIPPSPPPAAPGASAPAESRDSEMAVLEAVSRGEISVDEAMVLLSRLEAERARR